MARCKKIFRDAEVKIRRLKARPLTREDDNTLRDISSLVDHIWIRLSRNTALMRLANKMLGVELECAEQIEGIEEKKFQIEKEIEILFDRIPKKP